MLLTKYSAQQKLHTLLKCHPDTIVELGINIQEDGEPKVSYKGKAQNIQRWFSEQKLIFTYDEVSLEIFGPKNWEFQQGVKFEVRYIYMPKMLPKIECFDTPLQAINFYTNTSKSIFCANVEANFNVNKLIDTL